MFVAKYLWKIKWNPSWETGITSLTVLVSLGVWSCHGRSTLATTHLIISVYIQFDRTQRSWLNEDLHFSPASCCSLACLHTPTLQELPFLAFIPRTLLLETQPLLAIKALDPPSREKYRCIAKTQVLHPLKTEQILRCNQALCLQLRGFLCRHSDDARWALAR